MTSIADQSAVQRLARWGLCALSLAAGGCGSLNLQPRWALSRLRMDDVSISDVQGPQERRLHSISRNRQQQVPSPDLEAHFKSLETAEKLYADGRYAEAEQAYAVLRDQASPKRGLRRGLFNRHQFDEELNQSPIEEDAIFGIAQCQFQQGRLADAEETYSALLKKYPSTRHLDTVSRQLFRIAREWLGFPDSNDQEIVQVAYGDAPPTIEQRQNRKDGWIPKFRDNSRPAFDVDGRGLDALRLIWLHDSAGPLADDALMMAANYHLRQGDNISAAQHYRLLQEQFTDSPHFKDSLMLGSHVLLASYNGAGYDPSPLEEAKQLKLMALQYPDIAAEDRERLQRELDVIADAEVEPLWKQVEFYLAKRQPESVVLHCNIIINRYPHSRYARMAAEVRERYTGEKLPPGWPNVPIVPPAEEEPAEPLPEAYVDARDLTAPESTPEPAAPSLEEPRRFVPRFLRRADVPPDLQPVSPSDPFLEAPRPSGSPGSGSVPDEPASAAVDAPSGKVRLQSPSPHSLWR